MHKLLSFISDLQPGPILAPHLRYLRCPRCSASVQARLGSLVSAPSKPQLPPLLRAVYVLQANISILAPRLRLEDCLTKLCRPLSVRRNASPIIWPGSVFVCAKADHGLNSEAYARYRRTDCFVLSVVWHIWCAMEELVDAVPAVCFDHATSTALCVLLYDFARVSKEHPRLDQCDGLVKALSSRLSNPDGVRVTACSVAHVICLIEITMVSTMVQGDVDIKDVTVEKQSAIRNAMTYDFIWGCTN